MPSANEKTIINEANTITDIFAQQEAHLAQLKNLSDQELAAKHLKREEIDRLIAFLNEHPQKAEIWQQCQKIHTLIKQTGPLNAEQLLVEFYKLDLLLHSSSTLQLNADEIIALYDILARIFPKEVLDATKRGILTNLCLLIQQDFHFDRDAHIALGAKFDVELSKLPPKLIIFVNFISFATDLFSEKSIEPEQIDSVNIDVFEKYQHFDGVIKAYRASLPDKLAEQIKMIKIALSKSTQLNEKEQRFKDNILSLLDNINIVAVIENNMLSNFQNWLEVCEQESSKLTNSDKGLSRSNEFENLVFDGKQFPTQKGFARAKIKQINELINVIREHTLKPNKKSLTILYMYIGSLDLNDLAKKGLLEDVNKRLVNCYKTLQSEIPVKEESLSRLNKQFSKFVVRDRLALFNLHRLMDETLYHLDKLMAYADSKDQNKPLIALKKKILSIDVEAVYNTDKQGDELRKWLKNCQTQIASARKNLKQPQSSFYDAIAGVKSMAQSTLRFTTKTIVTRNELDSLQQDVITQLKDDTLDKAHKSLLKGLNKQLKIIAQSPIKQHIGLRDWAKRCQVALKDPNSNLLTQDLISQGLGFVGKRKRSFLQRNKYTLVFFAIMAACSVALASLAGLIFLSGAPGLIATFGVSAVVATGLVAVAKPLAIGSLISAGFFSVLGAVKPVLYGLGMLFKKLGREAYHLYITSELYQYLKKDKKHPHKNSSAKIAKDLAKHSPRKLVKRKSSEGDLSDAASDSASISPRQFVDTSWLIHVTRIRYMLNKLDDAQNEILDRIIELYNKNDISEERKELVILAYVIDELDISSNKKSPFNETLMRIVANKLDITIDKEAKNQDLIPKCKAALEKLERNVIEQQAENLPRKTGKPLGYGN